MAYKVGIVALCLILIHEQMFAFSVYLYINANCLRCKALLNVCMYIGYEKSAI